ncbi:hypothetical protein WJX73_010663 [Symbiochloris irregularis]|uniref:Uncharacterized protein n=1 Tax=Symbiochloris irregularis TaxID=706552 RepID=A0AAW1PBE1_9CHLO
MVRQKAGAAALRARSNKKAAKASEDHESTEQNSSSLAVPARVRRKLSRRVDFLSKVAASSLSAKKPVNKRRRRTAHNMHQ